jgi:fructokinase
MPAIGRQHGPHIGLDLGGSKIEGILIDSSATELARYRIATPPDDYADTIRAIADLTARLMQGSKAMPAASP